MNWTTCSRDNPPPLGKRCLYQFDAATPIVAQYGGILETGEAVFYLNVLHYMAGAHRVNDLDQVKFIDYEMEINTSNTTGNRCDTPTIHHRV